MQKSNVNEKKKEIREIQVGLKQRVECQSRETARFIDHPEPLVVRHLSSYVPLDSTRKISIRYSDAIETSSPRITLHTHIVYTRRYFCAVFLGRSTSACVEKLVLGGEYRRARHRRSRIPGPMQSNSFTEDCGDLPRRSGAYLEVKADTCTHVDYIVTYIYVGRFPRTKTIASRRRVSGVAGDATFRACNRDDDIGDDG